MLQNALPIRPVTDEYGQPALWDYSTEPDHPVTLKIEIANPSWLGYQFTLSYLNGEIIDVHISRDQSTAVPLTAHLLQRIPLGALETYTREWVLDFIRVWEHDNPPVDDGDAPPSPFDSLERAVTDGRDNERRMARIAARYIELDGAAGWKETIAAEFSDPPKNPLAAKSVPKIIERARRRRLLIETEPGKVGRLHPKAHRLLRPPPKPVPKITDEQRANENWRSQQHMSLYVTLKNGAMTTNEFHARFLAMQCAADGLTPREVGHDGDRDLDFPAILRFYNEYVALRKKEIGQ